MMWQKFKKWFHSMGSPGILYPFAGKLIPWLLWPGIILLIWGMYQALFVVPSDYQQGDSYRILFIHVPSAWMSMFIYAMMAISGGVAVIWRIKTAEIMAVACAPIGAAFTVVTLATGSLWGKPMWGTWWEWDARLTSELFLLFLYLGVLGLYHAIEDHRKAARAAGLLSIVGMVNLPVIHFSVNWWNTLHQGATIKLMGESGMDSSMMLPLILLTFATKFLFGAALMYQTRVRLIDADRRKQWVKDLVNAYG